MCLSEDWETAQQVDPDIQTMRSHVEIQMLPGGPERKAIPLKVRRLLQQRKKLVLRHGVLCWKVIDSNIYDQYFQVAAHAGVERTLSGHVWRKRYEVPFWVCNLQST